MTGNLLPNPCGFSRVASVLSVCVPTRLIFTALRILAVLLGLAIRFSKSDLRLLRSAGLLYIYNRPPCNFFFAALLLRFCFALAPFRGEGGSFYIRCLKVVKVLFSSAPANRSEEGPCVRGRYTGFGASLRFARFRAAVKEADQVITSPILMWSDGSTVRL